jgi:hypothetical protein
MGVDGSFLIKDNNLLDFQIATGQNEKDFDQNRHITFLYIRTGDLMGAQLSFNRVEPAFEINRIGYIQKETDRGWNKALGIFRISPRINKYNIRRIIANLKLDYTSDIFTASILTTGLKNILHHSDRFFGTVNQSENGGRYISGGKGLPITLAPEET